MNGVLVVNKPMGCTSFDVVAILRRLTGEKRIGHCGTLDPNATGVLPVLIGKATKAQDILPDHDKCYVAEFSLGTVTDTLDIWGKVISKEKTFVKEQEILDVLCDFSGEIEQIPPMYSAIKQDGRRLYDLAREGIEVKRESRRITVYSIELLSFDEDAQCGKLRVACSKGTYIRTLIDDIAKRFCTGGVMTSLVRTSACGFPLSCARTVDELRALSESGDIESVLMPVESLFVRYCEITVSEAQAKRFANGGALLSERIKSIPNVSDGDIIKVKDARGIFIGLGKYSEKYSEIKVYKQFADYSLFA